MPSTVACHGNASLIGEYVTRLAVIKATTVTDWDFTNQFGEIFVQTNTTYGIPHSVTAWCAEYDGDFYLFSSYRGGGQFPRYESLEPECSARPRVRLKIGDRLFDRTLRHIDNESIRTPVYQAFVDKYPDWRSPGQHNVHIFLVEPAG